MYARRIVLVSEIYERRIRYLMIGQMVLWLCTLRLPRATCDICNVRAC